MLRLSLLRGRLLNLAQTGVMLACLWKFLVVLIIWIDLFIAGWSLWRRLGVTDADVLAFVTAAQTRGPLPPRLNALFEYIANNEDALAAHFARVRDGYALELALLLIAIGVGLYVSTVALRTYLFEGMNARPVNAGERARLEKERLLNTANQALPPVFPKFRLRIARSTFIRRRWWGGLTIYLGNFVFALLESEKRREFQFVLTHELFHVRCGDSFFNIVTKSLRGLLSFAVAFGASYVTFIWIGEWRWMPSNARLAAAVFWAVAAAGTGLFLIRYFDRALRRHKELLADQFASDAYPDVDLKRVYRGVRSQPTHPKPDERRAFLRDGTTDTAAMTFFGMQEVVAFCACVISPGAVKPIAEIVGPKLLALEIPAFWVALCSLGVFAWEAWRTPIPEERREAVAKRGVVALASCVFLAAAIGNPWFKVTIRESGFAPAIGESWFGLAQVVLIILVLVRTVRARTLMNILASPQLQIPQPHPVRLAPIVFHPHPESSPRPKWGPLAARLGVVSSWFAVVLGMCGLFQAGLNRTLQRPLQAEAFPVLEETPWPFLRGVLLTVVVVMAAARNVKRPAFVTLLIEWFFYAALAYGFGAFGLWIYDRAYGRTAEQIMTGFMSMPWGDPDKMSAIGPFSVAWWRVILATLVVQVPLVWLYAGRVHAWYQKRRKEKEDAALA